MDLITLMIKKNICGLREDEFESILRHSNDNIRVKTVNHGMIILDNNSIIKCVCNYYKLPEHTKLGKHNNIALQCHHVHSAFDISVGLHQCEQCHLQCLNKKRQGYLKRHYLLK